MPAPRPIDAEARTEEALSSVLQRQAQRVSTLVAPAGAGSLSPAEVTPGEGIAAALIPEPLLSTVTKMAARGALGDGGGSPLGALLNSHAVSFTLHENGLSSRQVTQFRTVGAALAGAGVELGPADTVIPAADSQLSPGMHVYADYATDVRLLLGSEEMQVSTQAMTVGGMLHEQGVELQASDRVIPGLSAEIKRDMAVKVTLVRDVIVHEDELIPFTSVVRYDYELPLGQRAIVQSGDAGAVRRTYEVRTVDGNEISRELVSEETIPPTIQIVHLGAKTGSGTVANGAEPPGEGDCRERMDVWATYYTAASAGTGTGITRTGTGVYKGIIATDPNVIPLGTRMYVPGYGYGVAADTGGGVIGAHIDLGYGANDVYDWGSRHVEICIIG